MPILRLITNLRLVTKSFLVIFFVVIFFGIYSCADRMMQMYMPDGNASLHMKAGCFSVNAQSGCPMNLNEHLTIWQNMFLTTFNFNIAGPLSIILTVGAAVYIFSKKEFIPTDQKIPLRYWCYRQSHKDERLYNYLARILANGVLQPKIFA
ncbi:MAG: hypothetical protein HY982_00995 [Candidatus Magasanikbacteria bacterium]|nr:hypothetical protein [Candidatus Magasanikbacteria bacterium]